MFVDQILNGLHAKGFSSSNTAMQIEWTSVIPRSWVLHTLNILFTNATSANCTHSERKRNWIEVNSPGMLNDGKTERTPSTIICDCIYNHAGSDHFERLMTRGISQLVVVKKTIIQAVWWRRNIRLFQTRESSKPSGTAVVFEVSRRTPHPYEHKASHDPHTESVGCGPPTSSYWPNHLALNILNPVHRRLRSVQWRPVFGQPFIHWRVIDVRPNRSIQCNHTAAARPRVRHEYRWPRR